MFQSKNKNKTSVTNQNTENQPTQFKQTNPRNSEETSETQERGSESEVQQFKTFTGGANTSSPNDNTSQMKASGKSIPNEVQTKMEGSFNEDFSDVKIGESASVSKMGALAYTQGNQINFAPGQFKPDTKSGQELLGHELTHVVQQRKGQVKPTTSVGGIPVNDSPSLEGEADRMGAKAAAGMAVQMKSSGTNNSSFGNQVFQMKALTSGITESAFVKTTWKGFGITNWRPSELTTMFPLFTGYEKAVSQTKEYFTEHNASVLEDYVDLLETATKHRIEDSKEKINDKGTSKNLRSKLQTANMNMANFMDSGKPFEKEKEAIGKAKANFAKKDANVGGSLSGSAPEISAAQVDAYRLRQSEKAEEEAKANQEDEYFDEDAEMDIAAGVEAFLSPVDAVIGGDNRSGLADLDKYKGVGQDEKRDGLSSNNNSQLNFVADSMVAVQGLLGLGLNIRNVFKSPSADSIVDLVQSLGTTTEGVAKVVAHAQNWTGKDSALSGKIGSAAESFNAFMDVLAKGIKKIAQLIRGKTAEEKEQEEIDSLKQNSKLKSGLEAAQTVFEAGKSISLGVKAGFELFKGAAPDAVTNFIPGFDIAISGVSLIFKSVDFLESLLSYRKMMSVQSDSKKGLLTKMKKADDEDSYDHESDKEYMKHIDDAISDEKDLRAKKANLQAIYDADSKKLDNFGTNDAKKQTILDRRQATKDAIAIIDEKLTDKENQFSDRHEYTDGYGIAKDDDDLVDYKLSKDLKEEAGGRLWKRGTLIATEITKMIGSILTFAGPAAPAGAILKGIASGVEFGIMAGEFVVEKARDWSAAKKSLAMIDKVKNASSEDEKQSIADKREDSLFSINENKSSAAKLAEKKNHYAMIVNMIRKFPEEINERQKQTPDTPEANVELVDYANNRNKRIRTFLSAYGIKANKLIDMKDKNKQAKYLAKLLMEN